MSDTTIRSIRDRSGKPGRVCSQQCGRKSCSFVVQRGPCGRSQMGDFLSQPLMPCGVVLVSTVRKEGWKHYWLDTYRCPIPDGMVLQDIVSALRECGVRGNISWEALGLPNAVSVGSGSPDQAKAIRKRQLAAVRQRFLLWEKEHPSLLPDWLVRSLFGVQDRTVPPLHNKAGEIVRAGYILPNATVFAWTMVPACEEEATPPQTWAEWFPEGAVPGKREWRMLTKRWLGFQQMYFWLLEQSVVADDPALWSRRLAAFGAWCFGEVERMDKGRETAPFKLTKPEMLPGELWAAAEYIAE